MATVSENPAHRALAVRIVAPLEPDDRSILREYAEDLLISPC